MSPTDIDPDGRVTDAGEAASTVVITAADGTVTHAGALTGVTPPSPEDDVTGNEEFVGYATGELYTGPLPPPASE